MANNLFHYIHIYLLKGSCGEQPSYLSPDLALYALAESLPFSLASLVFPPAVLGSHPISCALTRFRVLPPTILCFLAPSLHELRSQLGPLDPYHQDPPAGLTKAKDSIKNAKEWILGHCHAADAITTMMRCSHFVLLKIEFVPCICYLSCFGRSFEPDTRRNNSSPVVSIPGHALRVRRCRTAS